MKQSKLWFILLAIAGAVMTRLLPHPWNFTPMAGITLFGACYFRNRILGFVVPLLAWVVSDLLVNVLIQRPYLSDDNYFLTNTALGVYLSLILIFGIGNILRRNMSGPSIIIASVASSLLFFIISNTLVFFGNPIYSQDMGGLLRCYSLALPFYNNDFGIIFGSFFLNGVIGDLFFSGLLFGSYYLVNNRSLRPAYI